MKLAIIVVGVCVLGAAVFLVACAKRGPEAEAGAAIDRGEFQFIALLDQDGNWTRPEFPDIPAWYFETTGIRMKMTSPDTKAADAAYMKSYNDALYKGLKDQGKFSAIEESIAKVRKNLDAYEQSKKKN